MATPDIPSAPPSGKRFFYNDPLAAAYMGKHHSMAFQLPPGHEHQHAMPGHTVFWLGSSPDDILGGFHIQTPDQTAITPLRNCEVTRLYVHPDSAYLLEPRPVFMSPESEAA